MEITIPTLIGIATATMFFGYFFGLFEGRGQGYRKRKKEEELDGTTPAVSASNPADALLDLRLDESGKPGVRVDGVNVDPKEVGPDLRKRLIELMVMLRPWVDSGPAATPDAAAAKASHPNARAKGSRVSTPKLNDPRPPASPQSAAVVAQVLPTPAPAAASLSLVAQIDSVLQAWLEGTPLAEKGIRLAESLNGGAIVFIGRQQFDGVDKVSDPEVQAAIRAAIAEWERKYVPA